MRLLVEGDALRLPLAEQVGQSPTHEAVVEVEGVPGRHTDTVPRYLSECKHYMLVVIHMPCGVPCG